MNEQEKEELKAAGFVFPHEAEPPDFMRDLRRLLNRYSKENGSHTPDFLLADYLAACLAAYDAALTARDKWFDFHPWGKPEPVPSELTPQQSPPNGRAEP